MSYVSFFESQSFLWRGKTRDSRRIFRKYYIEHATGFDLLSHYKFHDSCFSRNRLLKTCSDIPTVPLPCLYPPPLLLPPSLTAHMLRPSPLCTPMVSSGTFFDSFEAGNRLERSTLTRGQCETRHRSAQLLRDHDRRLTSLHCVYCVLCGVSKG